MTARAIEVDVVVRWTGNDWDGRTRCDHALFTPYRHAEHQAQPAHGLGRAFPRSQQVPAPTEVERTILMPAVGADGLPVTGPTTTVEEPAAPSRPDAESTTVLPQLPGEQRPALQGWSDIDEHLHRVDRDLAPLPGGWWWSCCDKTVTCGQPRDLDQVPVEQLCPRCWDVEANAGRAPRAAAPGRADREQRDVTVRDGEAPESRTCGKCGRPGWETWNDANSMRSIRMDQLREATDGSAPALMIRRCKKGLYHVGAPVPVISSERQQ